MKANELRIGNLVEYNGNVIDCVDVMCDGINTKDIEGINIVFIHPIPLNEEWLLNFGFSTTDYKKGYIGIDHKAGGIITDFVLTYPLVNGVFQKHFIWEHSKFKYQELKHVHQLQNLYFALTGEELTIKNQSK
jgi:hypothetical protein